MKRIIEFILRLFRKEVTVDPIIPRKPIDDLIIDTKNTKQYTYIVIHHSASTDQRVNDWIGIRKYHTSWRYRDETVTEERARELLSQGKSGVVAPWRDIGYHFGLEYDNDILVYRSGRSLSMIGAHAAGFNDKSIGICVVGNYDKVKPVPEQLSMLKDLVFKLQKIYSIDAKNVIGHREVYTLLKEPVVKTCPGTAFNMDEFRSSLV